MNHQTLFNLTIGVGIRYNAYFMHLRGTKMTRIHPTYQLREESIKRWITEQVRLQEIRQEEHLKTIQKLHDAVIQKNRVDVYV
jgi:hypothetical protein